MLAAETFKRNGRYIKDQFHASWTNTSIALRLLCGLIVILYLLSFYDSLVKVLSVTPGDLLPPTFWIWTAFTHCFLELHFWEVCVDIITLGLCGKLIEPLWGTLEMSIFFAIVNIGVAILTTIYYLLLFMVTSDPDLLFHVHIHGLSGYIAGVCVVVKQVMPDHVLVRTSFGKITNRNVPLNVYLLSLVLWFIGLLEGTYCSMFLSGMLISWVYLRFYQRHKNGTHGDMADSFSFASFFPNVVQPPIAVLCNTLHGILVKMKLCKSPVKKYDLGSSPSISITLPGDNQDAERRRQIALKALNERLTKVAPPSNWPSLDDEPLIHEPKAASASDQSVSIPVPEDNLGSS